MVPKTRLVDAEEVIADLKTELDRRRTLQKDMVQKSELEKCTEDLRAAMMTMMQTQLSQMKTKYEGQIDHLRSLLEQMVPRADLSRCEEQRRLIELDRDELKRLMQDMVPRAQFQELQEAMAALRSEAGRLHKSNFHSC
jgi:multidrug resistance efflux pump